MQIAGIESSSGKAQVLEGPIHIVKRERTALTFTVGNPGERVFIKASSRELRSLMYDQPDPHS